MAAGLRLRVPKTARGLRLDRFLAGLPQIGSRAEAERLLMGGAVLVDDVTARKSLRLRGLEEVAVELAEGPPDPLEPEPMALEVPFEDEWLLVVDKPAGLVVHPAPGHPTGTLVQGLLPRRAAGGEEEARPGIVHRLDRDTSGLMVVARSDEAHRRLRDLLRRRRIERGYVGLVRGRPASRRGRIEAPIGRDRRDPLRQSLDTESPRDATTHFALRELLPRHALLDVSLETGRTHQIRVHLAAIGLPLSGDRAYGSSGDLGLSRQFLHAARLAFPHPMRAGDVEVASALPPDLEAALARARAA